jgi:hypothetical protein
MTLQGIAAEVPNPQPCAKDFGTCNFSGTREIVYGVNGSYLTGVFTGSVACNPTSFGGDPMPNVVKTCTVRGNPLTVCASQGQTCPVSGLSEVFYSSGSGPDQVFVTRSNVPCVATSFTNSPVASVNNCYVRPAREWARVMYMLQLAQSGEVGLVYQATVLGQSRGGYYIGNGMFQTDNLGTQATLQNLYDWAAISNSPVQLTLVPRGTEYRIGVDANLNGHLNGDELASGVNPRAQSAGTWTQCAPANGTCNLTGTHVVRFGVAPSWTYQVVTGGLTCSAAAFGDPSPGATEECDVAN